MTTTTYPTLIRERRRQAESLMQNYGILVGVILLGAIFTILTPNFLTKSNLLNVASQMAIPGVLAVGMTMLMVSGAFDLSVGSTLGLSGALCLGLASSVSLPGAIAIVVSVGLVIGLLNGIIVTKVGINALIVTLGMQTLIRGVVLIYTNGSSIAAPNDANAMITFTNGSWVLPTIVWILIGAALIGSFVMARPQRRRLPDRCLRPHGRFGSPRGSDVCR
jgi:ribose/xylose/arabinose/galactoside ABC-type transport system permease subunit